MPASQPASNSVNTALVEIRLVSAKVNLRAAFLAVEVSNWRVSGQALADDRRSRLQVVVTFAAGEVLHELRISTDDASFGRAARACQVEVGTVCIHQVACYAVTDVLGGNRPLNATAVAVDNVVVDFDTAGWATVVVGFLAAAITYSITGVSNQSIVHDQCVVVVMAKVDTLASSRNDVVHDHA